MAEETRRKEQSTSLRGGREETQGRLKEKATFGVRLDKRADIYQVRILGSSYSGVCICMCGGRVLCQAENRP